MTETRDLPRQSLPNAPRGADGRPVGSRCTPTCRASGPSHAHCSVCHHTLATLTDFDRHRRDGWCLDLPAMGLVQRDRLWASLEGHDRRDRDAEKVAKARSQRLRAIAERRTAGVTA